MPECQECGGFVSADFQRVFGSPDTGDVYGCPECMEHPEIAEGDVAQPG